MAEILNTLRTAPSPQGSTISSGREILASIPREAFALEPIQYLTAVLDSVAPLVKIRQQKGVLGGGASMPVPVPLTVKQRRRQAIQWILAAAEKRREPKLAERIAKEIIGIAEGRSSAWERRGMVHKMAISARANVRSAMQRKRVKRKVF
jgi:small subunit ribosomal protein S7